MVRAMIDEALVASIAQQMMASDTVDVNGKFVPVSRTIKNRFRRLAFTMGGREYQTNSSERYDCLTVVSHALQAGRIPCF
jgi:hypothetical protein